MRSHARHTRHHRLHVFLDRDGSLLIEHLSRGHPEALELEADLGLPPLVPLGIMWSAVRAEGLDEAARARVRAAAEERHWEFSEIDKLDPPPPPKQPETAAPEIGTSTVEALHAHSLAPSTREKVFVPVIVLGILAAAAAVGYVVWDHSNHDFRRARSLADLLVLAGNPAPAPGALASLVNPDDARYVAWDVTGWQAWVGRAAVTENTLVRMPALDLTMEDLVKGDRGSARLVLRFDLGRTDGNVLLAERIVRGGITLPYKDTPVAFHPLRIEEIPKVSSTGEGGVYAVDGEIRHDKPATFTGRTRIAANGFLEQGEDGLRFTNSSYRMTLGAVEDPGLAALIEELRLTPEESRVLEAHARGEGKLTVEGSKRVIAFVTLEEVSGGRSGDRGIGTARLDGLQVSRIFVRN